jgi:hypothetical protein
MTRTQGLMVLVAAWVVAPVAQAPLFAGRRIAPVTSSCTAERPQREVDADGVKDRCVARSRPTCPTGTELRSDVNGEADACVAGSAGGAAAGSAPQCVRDSRLRPAAGEDVCEQAGSPACPPSSKLKAAKGQDRCHY